MIFSLSLSLFSPRSKLMQISVRKSRKSWHLQVAGTWQMSWQHLTKTNEKRLDDTILWYASLFGRGRGTYQLYPRYPCSGCRFRHLQDGVLSDLYGFCDRSGWPQIHDFYQESWKLQGQGDCRTIHKLLDYSLSQKICRWFYNPPFSFSVL